MNTKVKVLSSAILMGISSIAVSADPPAAPGAATIYQFGPQSPLAANTDLSEAEREAYALYEGILKITEAKIHATSCQTAADSLGTTTVNTWADGRLGQQDFATVVSNGGSFKLVATALNPIPFRGQQVIVAQEGVGALGGSGVFQYAGTAIYNNVNNMMVANHSMYVTGINGDPDLYQGSEIKDFYRGSLAPADKDYFTIFDYGLQSLSKLGYPVNKYWQRSKSRRDNGSFGRTVFVKDRLVGATSFRISLDTHDYNNHSYFWQTGTLTIQPGVVPSAEVPAFNEAPFI
jgi:hypothetical protein